MNLWRWPEGVTGKALSAPVCEDLAAYPIKVEGGTVFIRL